MNFDLAAVILAAGMGTRMHSARAKVLHELGGEPLISRVIRSVASLEPNRIVLVIGHQSSDVEAAALASSSQVKLGFAIQREQRGTGDAARCALSHLESFTGSVLITYGDMPRLSPETIKRFLESHRDCRTKISFISVRLDNPGEYGRVVREPSGEVKSIIEASDATAAERTINEVNTGVYLVDATFFRTAISELTPDNSQGEYYLTDIVGIARKHGLPVNAWIASDSAEFGGINSREELAAMESQIREVVNRKLMQAGVTIIDPATAYISEQAEVGRDTIVGPNVQILGKCSIGEGVRIEGTAWMKNVTIGSRCHIKIGVRAEDCIIGEDSEVGPFANLRTGTELEGHNRIGNFVETKKAKIGRGSKASHLSYLGDATIGCDTNVGCGVITVNYDGYDKHHTHIGDRCMIGCDTQLVAPVRLDNDVYVASGTTIVRDVPEGTLVMSHHPQHDKAGWMAKFHRRHAGRSPWWEDK